MSIAHVVHEPLRTRFPQPFTPPKPAPSPPAAATNPVDDFRAFMRTASTLQRIAIEREGIPAPVVEALFERMRTTSVDFRRITGMPKASLARKLREDGLVSGIGGQAILCLIDMINRVEDMLNADGDEIARGFDVFAWLGRWIRRPQRALAGLSPTEMIDTPTGRESVLRVLGAIQSGVYL